jgi:MFS family permease
MPEAIHDARLALQAALANPGIRRLEIAWLLGVASDSALFVVLLVVAYARDGALGIGVLGAARMAPAIVGGVLSGAALSRWPARLLLTGLGALRALGAALIVLAVALAWPTPVLVGLAALTATVGAPIRPSQATLMPALARSPAELIAANVAWGSVEGLGSFGGPLIAGLVIAVGEPVIAAGVAAAGFLAAAAVVSGLGFEQAIDASASHHGGLRVLDGLSVLRRRATPAWTMAGVFLQTVTRGLLNSLIVVASVGLLGLGDPGVGLLNAAMGVGGLLGGVVAMSLVRTDRLARGVAVSLAYWGLPIACIGLLPVVPVAVVALVVVGLANAAFDVAAFTIFQRGCSNDERGDVFAIFEGAAGSGVVVGSLLGPVLLTALGERGALVAAGAILPMFAAVLYLRIGRSPVGVVDETVIRLLRRVPAFAELPLTAIERLAASVEPAEFAAGATLMRQGEPGERFIVIETGDVEVSVDGQPIHRLGAGDGVGEIALLRRSPRTATVVALTAVRALGVGADAFGAAIAGPAAAAVMERSAAANLARSTRGA